MENILPLLRSTSLFTGIEDDALRVLLSELGAVIRSYGKGEALVQAGMPNRRVGIVLTGSIEAYRPAPGGGDHFGGRDRPVRSSADQGGSVCLRPVRGGGKQGKTAGSAA